MKLLLFEVKRNLKTAPRIYVKSASTKAIYGSFLANEPENFDGWQHMAQNERIELKHYINNLNAVNRHLGIQFLDEQADYRLRLPISFATAIDEISLVCDQASENLDIFEPMLNSIIQTIKIAAAKLDDPAKNKVREKLEKLGLADYKKLDYSSEIQAIFSEILTVHNKSEKLHDQAKTLFDKDKSYSPKAIENMAKGEITPSKWLAACAIEVLACEKPEILKKILSEDDIFMLLAKPLLDHHKQPELTRLIKKHGFNFLREQIKQYSAKDEVKN